MRNNYVSRYLPTYNQVGRCAIHTKRTFYSNEKANTYDEIIKKPPKLNTYTVDRPIT